MEIKPQRTLTDLPFEVLDLIFKALAYGPSSHYWPRYTAYHYSTDKISLAETSEYLGQAFVYHSRDTYKKAIYNRSAPYISERHYATIISLCGSTTVEYVGSPGSCWSAEVAKAVGQYCPNLGKVTFQVYFKNGDILLSILHRAKNAIKSLNFGYATYDPSRIGPNIMHKIPELPLLSSLTIDRFFVDEAYEIQKFVNLEELYLQTPHFPHRDEPRPLNLFKVCSPLKKLRLLTVIGVHIISETDEAETLPEFPALEHFKLISCHISMEFPSCPKLKILNIEFTRCHIEGLVCRSVLKQGQDLERLIVQSRPSQFDNDSLLEVIRKFRKLRFFDVPIRKIKFDLSFVNELINSLRENGITEEDPLELVLDELSKIDWLRHWLSHVSSPNLIKLRVY